MDFTGVLFYEKVKLKGNVIFIMVSMFLMILFI